MTKWGLFIIFSIIVITLPLSPAFGESMTSQKYTIQGGNFTIKSSQDDTRTIGASEGLDEAEAGLFASKGSIILSDRVNSQTSKEFSLAVFPNTIEYGEPAPLSFTDKKVQLKILPGNSPGYSIFVSEDHPPNTISGTQITDTLCNTKREVCTYLIASPWTEQDAFGFGYTVIGESAADDFKNDSFFRPFPSQDLNQVPVRIIHGYSKNSADEAVVKLRLNPSAYTPAGFYRNTITFTALPAM